jgi:hypothetical protein
MYRNKKILLLKIIVSFIILIFSSIACFQGANLSGAAGGSGGRNATETIISLTEVGGGAGGRIEKTATFNEDSLTAEDLLNAIQETVQAMPENGIFPSSEQVIELVSDLNVEKHKFLADTSVTYPIFLQTGTDESIIFELVILEDIIQSQIDVYDRVDVSPFSSPEIGKLATHYARIAIGSTIHLRLDAPSFVIHEEPTVTYYIGDNTETNGLEYFWLWSISAPETPGNYRFKISIFLDEKETETTWVGDYQIKVIAPSTSTPVPSPTDLPKPTQTPVPTETPTQIPSPTPVYAKRLMEDIKSDTGIALEIIVGLITAGILSLIALIYRKMKSEKKKKSNKPKARKEKNK